MISEGWLPWARKRWRLSYDTDVYQAIFETIGAVLTGR